MLKSLTAKAIVPVALSVTGFVVVCCILLYSVLKKDLTGDAITSESNLADMVIKSTRYAMIRSDREMLRNIIDNIGDQRGIEHLRIFNKKGVIMFSRNHGELNRVMDKKGAGCVGCHAGPVPATSLGPMGQARRFVNEWGIEVIAITVPIYNYPTCSNTACHFHDPAQKVLGTLDIGLSAAPLVKTLSMMRKRMIIFSIMVLILTVGGVAALLRRNVFVPLMEIKEFTAKVNDGNLTGELTGVPDELAELAGDIRGLAAQLKSTVQELELMKDGQGELEERLAVETKSI
jgi:HAMP domain-containing protein